MILNGLQIASVPFSTAPSRAHLFERVYFRPCTGRGACVRRGSACVRRGSAGYVTAGAARRHVGGRRTTELFRTQVQPFVPSAPSAPSAPCSRGINHADMRICNATATRMSSYCSHARPLYSPRFDEFLLHLGQDGLVCHRALAYRRRSHARDAVAQMIAQAPARQVGGIPPLARLVHKHPLRPTPLTHLTHLVRLGHSCGGVRHAVGVLASD